MTFDETVKYINEKIECCAEYKKTLIAQKDGTLKFGSTNINLFDLYDDGRNIYGQYGIFNIKNKPSGISYIGFYLSDNNLPHLADFASSKDAERVYNALLHLRSICTKENAPFGN